VADDLKHVFDCPDDGLGCVIDDVVAGIGKNDVAAVGPHPGESLLVHLPQLLGLFSFLLAKPGGRLQAAGRDHRQRNGRKGDDGFDLPPGQVVAFGFRSQSGGSFKSGGGIFAWPPAIRPPGQTRLCNFRPPTSTIFSRRGAGITAPACRWIGLEIASSIGGREACV